MEKLQHAFVLRTILDGEWNATTYDKQRVMSAAEIDAIADFAWSWPGVIRVWAACAQSIRSLWRARPSLRAPGPAMSGES